MNVRDAAAVLTAFLLGIPLAFFFAFNAVFTDGPMSERLVAFGLTLVAFLVAALLLGFWLPHAWTALALAAPAVLFLAFYTTREPQDWPLHLLDVACVAVGAFGGFWLARRMRRPQTQR